ncbi:DnaB-like helicase N-terminal domain-containing protein [Rhodococcus sp. G-MC3]|uniref:DnaB-like helicase N-terminal domain-containing protein n=1 Tax=Rhodococcus sp. G-MC3 TaxID=3046209 RepID=UPI0024BA3916|nr:DnaB-like helicase N-terminal domain-containing protein [Rhodococcus sp. G-MC3]MDJ0396185.1 DnaB-like helicase N-terminal domain-containing protein [Rhodococcus sp. G-MC3]
MTALHAVSFEPSENSAEELVEDLTDNPETAPEALAVCALMWSNDTVENRRIAAALQANDFLEPAYRQLYGVAQDLILASAPHDPASVLSVLVRSGSSGHKGALLRRALTNVTTANACGASASDYAGMVLSEAYRRSFHDAGLAITQMAEEAPEEQLFERLVEIGRAQRDAMNRIDAFRTGTTL